MIKKIHYIWLGGKPKSKLITKCISSWRKYMPEWEIIEWNESNLNIHENRYAEEAYKKGKYAFASDYFRFKILCDYGGLYLDTDVEIIKNFDDLLSNKTCVMGFEYTGVTIGPGLILYADKPNNKFIKDMLAFYNSINFELHPNEVPDTICDYTTKYLTTLGLKLNNTLQTIDNVTIYPSTYFCPTNKEWSYQDFSVNTRCIHHYGASWLTSSKKSLIKKTFCKIIGPKGIRFLKKIKNRMKGN